MDGGRWKGWLFARIRVCVCLCRQSRMGEGIGGNGGERGPSGKQKANARAGLGGGRRKQWRGPEMHGVGATIRLRYKAQGIGTAGTALNGGGWEDARGGEQRHAKR